MQMLALSLTIILMLVVLASFVFVIRSTATSSQSQAVALEAIAPTAYRARAVIFIAVIFIGIFVAYKTLMPWPHPNHSQGTTQSVDVKGVQWSWDLPKAKIKVGDDVEFRVTGADVNHGFGLYSPAGQLVAQVQAMPGFENKLRYRFLVPGKYKILCMEYCGLGHHRMDAELEVE